LAQAQAGREARLEVIRAAGGVVTRDGDVLLVHRPKYDDWTIPKGKAEPGESDEECALREVEEETGLRCTLGRELPSVSYLDRHGRPKRARYWLMTPLEGSFDPTLEVDRLEWLAPSDASARLTYERDREVLRALEEA
jgi:8-oxo-dGTP diphosphatase